MSILKDLILQENDDYITYQVDQCILTQEGILDNLLNKAKNNFPKFQLYDNSSLPYIFHHHTDDMDMEKRVKLMKPKCKICHTSVIMNVEKILRHKSKYIDAYHEDLADEKYLHTPPSSFLFISKPNIGEVELARNLADHWKCIFISPESLIQEEIRSGSRVGKCISFNLQNGRSIGPEVILRLAERKVNSQSTKHRGFVISGFPLIPNEHFKPDPLSSESAVFNAEEIFEEILPTELVPERPNSASTIKGSKVSVDDDTKKTTDGMESFNGDEDEEMKKDNKPAISQAQERASIKDLELERHAVIKTSDSFTELTSVENQLKFLYSLFQYPMIIIYIMFDNMDVCNKIGNYRFNVIAGKEISFEKDLNINTAFSPETTGNPEFELNEFDNGNEMKESTKLPIHFNNSISTQLVQFKYKLQPIIEKIILSHDPRYFVKIDGRLSVQKMYTNIRQRLKILGLQPAVIPETIDFNEEIEGEYAGYPKEPTEADNDQNPQEAFENLQRKGIVSPMFKFKLSHLKYKCPVAFTNGKLIEGKAKHAVHYMDKIYFLQDQNAELSFCKNPRPYLLPIRLNPVYRILIIGPKYSGKTAISICLSYLFNLHIFDIASMEEEYNNKKKADKLETIRTAAITEGLLELHKQREENRRRKIEFWKNRVREIILVQYPEFRQFLKNKEGSIKSSDSTQNINLLRKSEFSLISEQTRADLQNELLKHNISLHNEQQIKSLMEDDKKLFEYVPPDLKVPTEQPSVYDHFIKEYVQNVLDNTIIEVAPLTTDEVIDMFQSTIKNFEENYGERQGWIVDGFPVDYQILKELFPNAIANEVICLRDDDPENIFLLARYTKQDRNDMTNFNSFSENMKQYSITRYLSKHINKQVYKLISKQIPQMPHYSEIDDIETVQANKTEEYAQHLSEFNQKWLQMQNYLSQKDKTPIEVNVGYKTLPEMLKQCMLGIENKYRLTAHKMTEEEKMQEHIDFGSSIGGIDEEEDYGESGPVLKDTFHENRRYGNTLNYCPIAYYEHFVLWKGKEEFAVSFENKTYLLSNEEALQIFVETPHMYIQDEPNQKIPPPRICITGSIGSGKTTISKALAENFGLFYINFENILLETFDLNNWLQIDDLLLGNDKKLKPYSKEIEVLRKYYLEEDFELPESIIKKTLVPLWVSKPYRENGFVLDSFPKKTSDVKFMTKHFLIPDLVIELQVNQEQIHNRLFQVKFDDWKDNIAIKKKQREAEVELILNQWEEECKNKYELLIGVYKEERKQEFFTSQPPIPPYSSPAESTTLLEESVEEEEIEMRMFIYDPIQEMEDLDEIKRTINIELPKPQFDDVWESSEEATDRIEIMLHEIYNRSIGFLSTVEDELRFENIDYYTINTNRNWNKVFIDVNRYADKYKFKNISFFERVYPISIDVAEKLLEQGIYFLGKFGRTCPVQVYEKINPVQMYLTSENRMTLYPMIYRKYIYFVCGSVHAEKFKQNPLLYVNNIDYKLPLFPLKIAIIGPPKSGKSDLAEQLGKEYGLKVVSGGQAARYVLKYLSNSELARNMKAILTKGWALTPDMIAASIEAYTLDGRSITQGYVLDGSPCSVDEVNSLNKYGIIPHIYLYISADEEKIRECTFSEIGRKFSVAYPYKLIKNRYEKWNKGLNKLTDCLHKEYQNIYTIPNPESKWITVKRIKSIVINSFFDILNYFKNRKTENAKRMQSLLVTPFEFLQKQSCYKHYCPCCIYFNDALVHGGVPPDREGLVQYLDHYYWICEDHLKEFKEEPAYYTPPINEKCLPKDLPHKDLKNCLNLHEDGLCIVCFWNNQPKRVLNLGQSIFGVCYKDVLYLLCSLECEKKFMKEPHKYFNKKINFRNPQPLELHEKLPTLGFLEQYIADLLTRALVHTEIARPVHPCMDIKTSAAIHIGLYLKINNPNRKSGCDQLYQESSNKFEARIKYLKELLEYFLGTQNPFCESIEYSPREISTNPNSKMDSKVDSKMNSVLKNIENSL